MKKFKVWVHDGEKYFTVQVWAKSAINYNGWLTFNSDAEVVASFHEHRWIYMKEITNECGCGCK